MCLLVYMMGGCVCRQTLCWCTWWVWVFAGGLCAGVPVPAVPAGGDRSGQRHHPSGPQSQQSSSHLQQVGQGGAACSPHLPADAGGVPEHGALLPLRSAVHGGVGVPGRPCLADQSPVLPLAAPVQRPPVDADQARGSHQAEVQTLAAES